MSRSRPTPRSRAPLAPLLLGLALLLALPACGGGGGAAVDGPAGPVVPVPFDGPVYQAFTAFGGLADAAVDIYTYETLGQGPRHVVPTAGDGSFGIPQYLVTPTTLLVVRVRGGTGSPDGGAPQENHGAFYGLFTPTQVEAETATVSLATTAIYLKLRHLCATNAPVADVTKQLHDRARCVLTGDLDGDNVETADDVAGDTAGAVDAMIDPQLWDNLVPAFFAGDPIPYRTLLWVVDPKQPQLITVNDTDAPGNQINRSLGHGTHAYVATGTGVLLYGYDPVLQPGVHLVNTFPAASEPQDIAIQDDVLFILGFRHIQAYDITDPIEPTLLDTLELTADVRGRQLTIAGTIAYLAMASEGIRMIDISDPANLTEVGTPIAGDFHSVSSRGRILFAGGPTNETAVHAYDLASPTSPVWLGQRNAANSARAVVATTPTEAAIVELGRWSHMEVTDGNHVLGQPNDSLTMESPTWPADTRLYGDILVTAFWDGTVEFADIHDRREPVRIPGITTPPVDGMGTIARADTAAVTDHALLVFQGSQVSAFTWDPLARPDPILSRTYIGLGSSARGVHVDGTRCYHGTNVGIRIFDILDPSAPTPRGRSDGGIAEESFLHGTTLYTGSSFGSMQVYDVSDPDAPSHENTVAGNHRGFDARGDRLYTGRSGDFAVMDISDPLAPGLLGTYGMTVASAVMLVGDELAYVTDRYAGGYTRVIDVTDATMPTQTTAVGPSIFGGRPGLIEWLDADHLLIGGFNLNSSLGAQLQVLDVSDPTNPVEAGEHFTPGVRHSDMAVRHGFAYLACDASIRIVDVRDLREPEVVGTIPAPRSWGIDTTPACGVAAVDDWGLITFPTAVRAMP